MTSADSTMAIAANSYSPAWFELFHVDIPEKRTAQEVDFISQRCPVSSFPRILDVCCGMGRHARALAKRGYTVTGVERDEQALTVAREKADGPYYVQADIRDYRPAAAAFDTVLILSQSFGYFDAETNLRILRNLSEGLRSGGCLVLDLWNPEFFQTRQGEHRFNTAAGEVLEAKHMAADRLYTHLDYPDGSSDSFEFQTFIPEQMEKFARPAELELTQTCTEYNLTTKLTSDKPKVQYILMRR